jgi:hypothetical protein
MNYPPSKKTTVVYGDLIWDNAEHLYKYVETKTHWCAEEAVLKYKQDNINKKLSEVVRDSELIIETLEEEIGWVEAGEATK